MEKIEISKKDAYILRQVLVGTLLESCMIFSSYKKGKDGSLVKYDDAKRWQLEYINSMKRTMNKIMKILRRKTKK